MHLPNPQFSRIVTLLAFDLSDPSLDSMFIAWDHISTRFLNRLGDDRALAGKIESIRLLAIHDAVLSILGPGEGFIFRESSTGTSQAAALAATAQASHDILANAFDQLADLADLDDALEESLSLISDSLEKAVGTATGSASAATFLDAFGPLNGRKRKVDILPAGLRASGFNGSRLTPSHDLAWDRTGLRRSA